MNNEQNSDNPQSQQLNIVGVMCSSCNTLIKQEDKKHVFFDEDLEQGIPIVCFDCYMKNEIITRDFGF